MKRYLSLDYFLGLLFIITPSILLVASLGGVLNKGYLIYSILMCFTAILMVIHGVKNRNLPFIILGVVLFAIAIVPAKQLPFLHSIFFYMFFLGYTIYILLLSRLSDPFIDLLQMMLLVVLVALAGFEYIAIFDAEVLGLVVIGQHFLFELEK